MPTMRDRLTAILSKAFEEAGYDASLGGVTVSNRPDLCQYQCNGALSAAKMYKKNPAMIAKEVIDRLEGNPIFGTVEFAPPGFINLKLSDGFFVDELTAMNSDNGLCLPRVDEPKTIVLDYGGPNVAKPLHVGHLRTAIIGESLSRLARLLGNKVITDVHLGDWGLQMGMIITGLEERRPDLPYFDENFTGEYPKEAPVSIDDLNHIYPEASARAKADEEFMARCQRATNELQNGRRGYLALWNHFIDVSVSDLKASYATLNVGFDYWYGESDAYPYVAGVIDDLKKRGLSHESDGAVVVDIAEESDNEPMPPILVEKSDGSSLYATTDIATIVQRMKDFKPDEIWYVVDKRQSLHFKQVFRCVRKAGYVNADTKLIHIANGTMNGKDGKPYKTREGGVMRLSDLIGTATDAAKAKIVETGIVAGEDVETISRQVGISALKLGDLSNHYSKDYIFDMDRFLATEGRTGPYLLYTTVRFNSILRRAQESGIHPGPVLAPASEAERDLALKLFGVGDSLVYALAEHAPSVVCDTLFDIAAAASRFYNENRILTCPDEARRASWLTLMSVTSRMLTALLDVIAVEVPENM